MKFYIYFEDIIKYPLYIFFIGAGYFASVIPYLSILSLRNQPLDIIEQLEKIHIENGETC